MSDGASVASTRIIPYVVRESNSEVHDVLVACGMATSLPSLYSKFRGGRCVAHVFTEGSPPQEAYPGRVLAASDEDRRWGRGKLATPVMRRQSQFRTISPFR